MSRGAANNCNCCWRLLLKLPAALLLLFLSATTTTPTSLFAAAASATPTSASVLRAAFALPSVRGAAATAPSFVTASSRLVGPQLQPARGSLGISSSISSSSSTTTTTRGAFARRAMTTTTATVASSATTATGSGSTSGAGKIGDGVTKRLTLLFVRRRNPETGVKEVLLGMKKRGFGQGKWNGFGGKVEPGETVPAAALRELEEEACVKAAGAELRGKITFTFVTIPDVLKVHVFEAQGPFTGEPTETEEMRPQWYAESAIPYDKMWADDEYWVPLFLEGKRFQALFEFDDESTILRHELRALAPDEALECDE